MRNRVLASLGALLLAPFQQIALPSRAPAGTAFAASILTFAPADQSAAALTARSGVPPVLSSTPPVNALQAGFAELYNLKFDRAQAEFERWMREQPDDPLGPACRLTVYLFQELHRLHIPHGSLLPGARPAATAESDPRLKGVFYEQLRKATDQAQRRLARQPGDESALLALTIIYATQADYLNLIERRSWASLTLFKKSNRYAQQLLKRNPNAHDAWAASGLSEYLAGSLPFYARWLVRFDSVKGDKRAAIEQLQRAATGGRYLRPYAKILLAGVYLRERRPQEGLRVLRELNSEFPDNVTIAAELKKLDGQFRQP